jgi:hypothetical protein
MLFKYRFAFVKKKYRFARAIWAALHAATGLPRPCSVPNMFENWLRRFKYRFTCTVQVMFYEFGYWRLYCTSNVL